MIHDQCKHSKHVNKFDLISSLQLQDLAGTRKVHPDNLATLPYDPFLGPVDGEDNATVRYEEEEEHEGEEEEPGTPD